MGRDHSDWVEMSFAQRAANKEDKDRELKETAAVGQRAFALSQNPHWDWFIEELNKVKANSDQLTASAQERLVSLDMVDSNEIMRLKLNIAAWKARSEAAEDFYALVTETIKQGEKAEAELSGRKTEDG